MYNNFNNSGPDWIMVSDIGQINQVTVQPGQKAWIMVQNEPVFALKVADQMGLAQTSMYKFERYEPMAGSSPYVTREEMEEAIRRAMKGENNESIS